MKLLDIINAPWAIQPAALDEIRNIYITHLRGEKIDVSDVEARLQRPLVNREQGVTSINNVAVIPIHGVIAKRMNLFTQISGGASTQLVERDIRTALDNDQIEAILLDIDSPGGTVDGTAELANFIKEARKEKPVYALANGLMASAAYWIGSAAESILITGSTTQVGSIGVVAAHVDISEADRKRGIKRTEIYAGKFKRIASQNEPLTAEGRQNIQAKVDYLYSLFVNAVADNREVSVETVLENMADGRIFIGQQAIDAGLVDGVSTLDSLITDLSSVGEPVFNRFNMVEAGALPSDDTDSVDNPSTHHEVEIMANEDTKPEITLGYLKANNPELLEQIQKDSFAEGEAEGRKAGADAERERIRAVHDQMLVGHEKLINECMFDGKTTGPEAAVKILAVEKTARDKHSANLHADAPAAVTMPPNNEVASDKAVSAAHDEDTTIPLEERAKTAWDNDAGLRAEFGTDFDSYLAYRRANENGQIKVLGRKTA